MQSPGKGTLHLVATPIGNLSDISGRAVRTLQDVCFIAAEDTRVTRKLLSHLGIRKPLVSCHAHNEQEIAEKLLARIQAGDSCALVTDAGTPGISDPGEILVRLCIESGIPITAIPGPCAAITALTLSGLPADRFVFEGFLPAASKKRIERLRQLEVEPRTMVFYEAPHKIMRSLADMHSVLGNRRVSISREMTKVFEETLRMRLSDAVAHFAEHTPRGEFVIVVEGAPEVPDNTDDKQAKALETAMTLIRGGMSVRDAVKEAARLSGCSNNKLYNEVIALKQKANL